MSEEDKSTNILKINFTKNKVIISGNLKEKNIDGNKKENLSNEIRSLLLLG